MATRIAVSIVAICIGIMLLSACGLPNLIPPARPVVSGADSFILWEQGTGPAYKEIGSGSILGNSGHIDAKIVLAQPSCPAIYLTGTISQSAIPSIALHSKDKQPSQVEITATLQPQRMIYTVNAIPFDGLLTIKSGCGAGTTYRIQARSYAAVEGTWHGATENPAIIIAEAIRQTPYDDRHGLSYHGTIDFTGNPCFHKGSTPPYTYIPIEPVQFSITFTMDNGATLVADTNVDVVTQGNPLETRYTVHGGPCDGQAFTATLRRR